MPKIVAQDPDRRRPDRRQPGDHAADGGRAGRRSRPASRTGRHELPRAGPAAAAARTAAAGSAASSAGRPRRRRRPARRVRQVPARADAAVPRDDHDAAGDAAAGARPAADGHHERVVHDRRRRAGRPDMGLVTPAQVTERPLPRAAGARRSSRRPTRPQHAEGRLEAEPERDVVHGRRTRRAAARRPGRRRLPAAGAAPEALRPEGLVNVVLVRADDSSSVARVEKRIETPTRRRRSRARSRSPARSAARSSTPSNLSHSLGLALSIVAAAAAFLLAALLTLSSVGKRVRELGTLKALGWTQRLVVRQVAASRSRRACSAASSASCSASPSRSRDRRVRPDADRELDDRRRQPLRCSSRRARTASTTSRCTAPIGVSRAPARLRARPPRRPARRRRRRARAPHGSAPPTRSRTVE